MAYRATANDIPDVLMRKALTLLVLSLVLPLLLQPHAASAATPTAAYTVTLDLSRAQVFVNQTVRCSGTVLTAAGKPASGVVTIQKRRASGGSWVNWRTDRLDASGAYGKRVRMTTSWRTWEFRARMPGNAANATAYSPLRNLRVTGPTSTETKVIALLNKERCKRGLRPLRVRYSLTRAARAHSREMAERGRLTHRSANGDSVGRRLRRHGYRRSGYRYWSVGENIARARAGTLLATPTAIVAAWIHSSTHRRVILAGRFRDVGVGIRTSSSGQRFFTLDLGRRIR